MTYYIPNRWAISQFRAVKDRVGSSSFDTLLHLASHSDFAYRFPPDNMKKEFRFESVADFHQALVDLYGSNEARDLALYAGEKMFHDSLTQFKSVAAAAQIAMKVGSLDAKSKIALEFFSKFLNAVSDEIIEPGDLGHVWVWRITRCSVCWNRQSDQPTCHLAVGFVEAMMRWASNGREFQVREDHCAAAGNNSCVITIAKAPSY